MSFDLSLARGLDYYTGIIYEVVTAESAPPGVLPASLENIPAADASATGTAPQTTGSNPEDEDAKVGVGSIAAGGRYDNLVGMFSPSGQQIPCVGISFGVERIFSILWKKRLAEAKEKEVKSKEVDVFVMAVGDGLLLERMQIAKELWDAGLRVSLAVPRIICFGG
jgi:histidyl-tRNA synthetase